MDKKINGDDRIIILNEIKINKRRYNQSMIKNIFGLISNAFSFWQYQMFDVGLLLIIQNYFTANSIIYMDKIIYNWYLYNNNIYNNKYYNIL